jgi:hypothetical protein
MDWFKKHVDAMIVLSGLLSCVFWMNSRFNEIDKQFSMVDKQFSEIHQDLAVMKTVLIMKNIMPTELAKCDENE